MGQGQKKNNPYYVKRIFSPQRSGTCSFRSIHAFVASSINKEMYPLFKFQFKLFVLTKHFPDFKALASTSILNQSDYDKAKRDISFMKRAIEKYAAGVDKNADKIPDHEIEKAQHTIAQYINAIDQFEKKLRTYEGTCCQLRLGEMNTVKETPVLIKMNSPTSEDTVEDNSTHEKKHSHELKHYVSQAFAALEDISPLNTAQANAEQIDRTLEAIASHFYGVPTPPYSSEVHYMLDTLCKKIVTVGGWDKINFKKPHSFDNLQKIHLYLLEHGIPKPTENLFNSERYVLLLFITEGIENVYKQLPPQFRIDNITHPTFEYPEVHLDFIDPFWQTQWTQMQAQKKNDRKGHSLSYLDAIDMKKEKSKKITLTEEQADNVLAWWIEQTQNIDYEIQENIKDDRRQQDNYITNLKSKWEENIKKFQVEIDNYKETINGYDQLLNQANSPKS